jgi:hypothetical protein
MSEAWRSHNTDEHGFWPRNRPEYPCLSVADCFVAINLGFRVEVTP